MAVGSSQAYWVALHGEEPSPEASADIVRHHRRPHRRHACRRGNVGQWLEVSEVEVKLVV